jgi:hypothetical protein
VAAIGDILAYDKHLEGESMKGALSLVVAVSGALLISCADAPPTMPGGQAAPSVAFTSPLVGEPLEELFYGSYFTHGTGSSIRDYACGVKVFADHRGVDILLRNFVVMDSGVTVIAAAPGDVVAVRDGIFDRSVQNGAGGFGNYVTVAHADGRNTIYGHLRSGSIAVSVAETVDRGDPLGLVGSSGNSNWPHLHFEVRRGATLAVDPFLGACNSIDDSMWQSQLPYQDPFMVLDHGISDVPSASLGDLLERLDDVNEFVTSDPLVFAWSEFFNVQADGVRVDLRRPDGTLANSVESGAYQTFSVRFFGAWFDIAGVLTQAGTYVIQHFHDNGSGFELVLEQEFELTTVTGPLPKRDPNAPTAGILAFETHGGDAAR